MPGPVRWAAVGRSGFGFARRESPASYLKVCAMLVPREMQVEHSGGVKAMTDEQIERGIALIKEIMAKREADANAKVIDGVPEPVPALPPPSRKARRKVRRSDRADSGLAARAVGTDSADRNFEQSTSAPRILSADGADAKSDISRGPSSTTSGREQSQQTA